jgi:hypothetical protein
MDVLLGVETNPSYAKPPLWFQLAGIGTILFVWAVLRYRLWLRRKRERDAKRPPDHP